MDVFEAIHNRHSIKKVRQDPVPRAVIEQLLDAAAQAPNHYRVRPWRFVVLTGEARNRLGDAMGFHGRISSRVSPRSARET